MPVSIRDYEDDPAIHDGGREKNAHQGGVAGQNGTDGSNTV